MYGDVESLQALAVRLRRVAAELRAEADAVLRELRRLAWTGVAAVALRGAVRGQVASMHDSAERFTAAAGLVEAHAAEVARRQALIAAAERWAASALSSALDTIGSVLPPPGHRDWLDLPVPGGLVPLARRLW